MGLQSQAYHRSGAPKVSLLHLKFHPTALLDLSNHASYLFLC